MTQAKLTQLGKGLPAKLRLVYSQWFINLIKSLTELAQQQLINLLKKSVTILQRFQLMNRSFQ